MSAAARDPSSQSSEPPEEYRAYFAHFERGEYYECHEVLERLWMRETGERRRFYQALIQLAVALYHLGRGNSEGGRKLLTAAEAKMREYPEGCMGMDPRSVADWCAELRASLPPDRMKGPPVPFPLRRLTMQGVE